MSAGWVVAGILGVALLGVLAAVFSFLRGMAKSWGRW